MMEGSRELCLWAIALAAGWGACLAVWCWERGIFAAHAASVRRTLASWTLDKKIVMGSLLICCVVWAQKPSVPVGNGEETNSVTQTSTSSLALDVSQPSLAAAATSEPSTPSASVASQTEPAHVVFQTPFATGAGASVAFPDEPGWTTPASVSFPTGLSAVSFDAETLPIPSPLRFSSLTNVWVQTLILCARGAAVDCATLVDGPEPVRIRIAAEGGSVPPMSDLERAVTEAFLPGHIRVLTADLETPVRLSDLFFGGSAGRSEWHRNWRGEIAEVIAFDVSPDEDVRRGVANYLAIRWGFGGYPATPAQQQAAVAAGLNPGSVWATILFIK